MTEASNLKSLLEPGEQERPTLKTIARLSGLAVPTVSRALSDAPDIGRDTKRRVREIADALGYRPNRAGLRLRTGKTNVVALIIRTEEDVMSHASKLITAIASELRGTAYHLIIRPYFPDEDPLDAVRYVVQTGSADGIILNRIQPQDPRVEYLRQHNFPFAMHGRTEDTTRAPFFDFDNAEFGTKSMETLAQMGRHKVLLVAPPRDQNYSQVMIGGAEEAARRLGRKVRVLTTADSDSPSDTISAAVARELAACPDVDAMIAASVPAAVAATVGAEEIGRMLGKDLDLIAKEAMPFLQKFRSQILVIREDVNQTGQFLARAIIQAIERPDLDAMQKLVKPG